MEADSVVLEGCNLEIRLQCWLCDSAYGGYRTHLSASDVG